MLASLGFPLDPRTLVSELSPEVDVAQPSALGRPELGSPRKSGMLLLP